jgi:hypothetical protein
LALARELANFTIGSFCFALWVAMGDRRHTMDEKILANQTTILDRQLKVLEGLKIITTRQKQLVLVLRNQAAVLRNQARVLRNQVRILANTKRILEKLKKKPSAKRKKK